MPVTFNMTNWNDTTFEVSNWTNTYPILDPALEQALEQEAYSQTLSSSDHQSDINIMGEDGFHFTRLEDPLTETQAYILMAISQTTAFFSVVGSSLIIYFNVRHQRYRDFGVFPRFMLGISSADIVLSLWVLTAYYAFPSEVGLHLTLGNDTSCSISGFMALYGAAGTNLYNAGLSLNFLFACVWGWRNHQIHKWIELPTHLACLFYLILPSIAASQNYLNTATSTRACMFGSEPFGCNDDPDIDCVRGGNDDNLYMALMYIHLAVLLICTLVAVVNTLVTAVVATRELQGSQRRYSNSPQIQDRIRKLRTRALLYGLSQLNTTIWSTIANFLSGDINTAQKMFPLTVISYIFFPSQGTLNALIFFQLPYKKCRKDFPQENPFQIFMRVLRNDREGNSSTFQQSLRRKSKGKERVSHNVIPITLPPPKALSSELSQGSTEEVN